MAAGETEGLEHIEVKMLGEHVDLVFQLVEQRYQYV